VEKRFFSLMSRARSLAGETALPLSEIRQALFALAEEEREAPFEEASASAAEKPPREPTQADAAGLDAASDLSRCRLAVYAWVDEILLNAARPDAAAWTAMSLQHAFFRTSEAGVLFFAHLDELLDQLLPFSGNPAEQSDAKTWLASRLEAAVKLRRDASPARRALDVYALCLLLGFRGRYFDAPEFCERLRQASRKILADSEGIRPGSARSQGRAWRQANKPLPPALEWLFYALLPLAATFLFGLYCANLLVDLPRIGF
jgi:type VI protein secretion system component VasF